MTATRAAAIGRRGFLAGAAATVAAWGLAWPERAGAGETRYFLGACSSGDGRTLARVIAPDGAIVATLPLPGRGHGAARRPGHREVVVFARRPGRFALAFDPLSGPQLEDTLRRIDAAPQRHFYGHGVFSRDGRWLFACENDYGRGRGVIGVYDASAGYRRESEFPSYAIGPHEMVLLSDGRRLAVANGGLLTHPDQGRRKLNIDTMAPSLAYIDTQSGALLHDHRLTADLHQLSIRHLAATARDEVGIVMQYEGPRDRVVPLVGLHSGDGDIVLPEAEQPLLRAMRQYCGSAAMDASGQILAASAPRGGLVTFWSLAERRSLGALALPDGCGVAAAGEAGTFLLSSGFGDLVVHNVLERRTEALATPPGPTVAWDNHLLALSL
jgi:uncharacterized protein